MSITSIIMREEKKYLRYWPVATMYGVALLLSFITTKTNLNGHFMSYFMGWTLILFGLLKLEDPKSFSIGFRRYDLFAENSELYAKAYPFLEVLLGVLFLFEIFLMPVTVITLAVYLSTALGLLIALHKGEDMYCLCLGTRFQLPLSIIAMLESLVMIGMAVWMLMM